MNLKDRINADLKAALKGGDEVRRSTLRLLLAAFRQAEFEKRALVARQFGKAEDLTPVQLAELDRVSLAEDELLAVVQKEAKSRRESLAEAQKADRPDLVAGAETELLILEGYLPQPLSRDEIVELARAAIAETGAAGARQIGLVMKVLTPRTKGRADGRVVSEVVRELLGG